MMTGRQFYVALAVLAASLLAGCRDRDDSAAIAGEPQAPQPEESQPTPEDEGAITPGGDHPWEQPGTQAGEEIIGPAGISLVWVPGGSFMMGSTDEDVEWAVRELQGDRRWLDSEQPAHEVELSGFWIGKTEVTVAQWRSAMGSVPDEYNDQGDDHPAVNVSWDDCKDFCEKTGLELPTEAQWEYAARGPDSRHYPWGDDWDDDRLCWGGNQGPGGRTFPVGSFPSGASWCGALDMGGNVWEWCGDRYDGGYYASSPSRDPAGPSSGRSRVMRGGSWYNGAYNCRAAYRLYHIVPSYRASYVGFRASRSCR